MKQLLTLSLLVLTLGLSSQTWYRTTGLDTAALLVNKGPTNMLTMNVAYAGTVTAYLKLYDVSTKPYSGSATPVMTIQLYNTATARAFTFIPIDNIRFKNGLYIRCATGITDTSTAQPASKPIVEIQY